MTPPPARRGATDADNSSSDRPVGNGASIRDLVTKLVTPEALNKLKQIARQGDSYKVASQIQAALESTRPKRRRDARHMRSIGYELVGDLYMKNLRKSIASLEEEGQLIGPNIFQSAPARIARC